MDFEKIVKQSPYLLILTIAIFGVFSYLPVLNKVAYQKYSVILSTVTFASISCYFGIACVAIASSVFCYLIHSKFLPHFVAVVDNVVLPVRISTISLYLVTGFLILEICIPVLVAHEVFHLLSILSFCTHVISYFYLIKICPFTLSFLQSPLQVLKIVFVGMTLVSVFCHVAISLTSQMMDIAAIVLCLLTALLYYFDITKFVFSYYSDVGAQNTIETLTDLDPLSIRELDKTNEVVI
ncbi:hypothetical protein EIN_086050 [Entamoeba invadens IP1]|uniref:hypothetical protein n=1 Tax=Entamoeba invadens IP1 TaxID=370355 RepID=UPI0002C3D68B|nr:hypothetical protein EIN_086050 [Entamoeba invadens IP1]ELP85353.1 hypothetical protein EIN_086050 [Entamoeba invadens IP1]|eukprot:XP_004184699.1 hypothetical protein EIN_086050 [Entamoeba invadens IP1]